MQAITSRTDRLILEISNAVKVIGQSVSGRVSAIAESVARESDRVEGIDFFPLGGSLAIAAIECEYHYYNWRTKEQRNATRLLRDDELKDGESLIGVNLKSGEIDKIVKDIDEYTPRWRSYRDAALKKAAECIGGAPPKPGDPVTKERTEILEEREDKLRKIIDELRKDVRIREDALKECRKDLDDARKENKFLHERLDRFENPQRHEGADIGFTALGVLPNWSSELTCQRFTEQLKQAAKNEKCGIREMVGTRDDECKLQVPDWLLSIARAIPGNTGDIANGLTNFVDSLVEPIDTLVGLIGTITGCQVGPAVKVMTTKSLLLALEKWTGIGLPKAHEAFDYTIDMVCPTQIPSVAETDHMFLTDQISKDVWECWVRANNTISKHHEKVVRAQRAQLSSLDVLKLWLRNDIDRDQAKAKLRGMGWIDNSEVDLLFKLAWETPTPSDLIPFVVRDVFDPQVVREFGLMDSYERKVGGDARKLFRAAGLNEDIVKLHWAAHWRFPSNTQLYTMYHRLRNRKGGTGVFRQVDEQGRRLKTPVEIQYSEVAVTETEILHALAVNDVLPFWASRLLAISRPPLTRVDVRRAYDINSITLEEVEEAFRDLGYSEANVQRLTKFTDDLKKRGDLRRFARLTPATVTRLYRDRTLSRDEASRLLSAVLFSPSQIASALEQSDLQAGAIARKKCLAAVRKRFMLGDIEQRQLFDRLRDIGLDNTQANVTAKEWACEIRYKAKEASASQLCVWFKDGLISTEQYLVRLMRIGYTPEDAERIATVCEVDRQMAIAKAEGSKPSPADREAAAKEVSGRIRGTRKRKRGDMPEANGAESPMTRVE